MWHFPSILPARLIYFTLPFHFWFLLNLDLANERKHSALTLICYFELDLIGFSDLSTFAEYLWFGCYSAQRVSGSTVIFVHQPQVSIFLTYMLYLTLNAVVQVNVFQRKNCLYYLNAEWNINVIIPSDWITLTVGSSCFTVLDWVQTCTSLWNSVLFRVDVSQFLCKEKGNWASGNRRISIS